MTRQALIHHAEFPGAGVPERTCGLPGATERFLREWQPDVVVLDCGYPSRVTEPRNHNTPALAVQIIERLSVPMAYLTHIGHELDREFNQGHVLCRPMCA